MRRAIFSLLLASALAAPAIAESDSDVVVTGNRLSDTARALKECIARKCAPQEDIRATLAHAENLFVAGQYRNASRVLTAARGRDQRFAKQFPVEVSDLMRANARVSAHLGEPEEYQIATSETLSALKAGLPRDDWRVLAARIELGDMHAKFGRYESAIDAYSYVARRSRELNYPRVEGLASLRLANLYSGAAVSEPGLFGRDADDSLARLINDPRPEMKPFAQAASVLKARIDARRGDAHAVDYIIGELRKQPATERPTLIYAPTIASIRESARGDFQTVNNTFGGVLSPFSQLPLRILDEQWVDISFYVTPYGSVADAGILRASPKLESTDWTKPIIAALEKRRYLPLKVDPTSPGVLRVERYTLTSWYRVVTGSRIPQRSPQPFIEMVDLSIDPPVQMASANR